ncbi:hypothetical protein BKA80DRAFT_258891 [Phyllosticta citrichinensis]
MPTPAPTSKNRPTPCGVPDPDESARASCISHGAVRGGQANAIRLWRSTRAISDAP